MEYLKYISTPKENDESNPLITTMRLSKGRFTGGWIYFPAGPAGTLNLIVLLGVHQILPFNTGESYRLDDCVVPLHLEIDLFEPPFEIDLITWNTSVLHDHALTVCFFIDPYIPQRLSLKSQKDLFKEAKGYHKP